MGVLERGGGREFASEVIDRVGNEGIREALGQVLASRLQVDASDS